MLRKKKAAVDTIEVSVARVGGKSATYVLNGKRSVEDALQVAGLRKKDSEIVQVNGEEAEMDKELEESDRVVLVQNIAGGLE